LAHCGRSGNGGRSTAASTEAIEIATVTRGTGQHHDLGEVYKEELPADRRPTPGVIAVLPRPTPIFVDAVVAGGGSVQPLSPDTRGVVWLSEKRADELAEVLAANPGIEWVQLPWAGVDAFADVLAHYADTPRPLWTSAKGAYSEPVAEHALALTLACLRSFPQKARATSWASAKTGTSLYGLEVVIVGAGGIARELIRLLAPFETRITVVRRTPGDVVGAAHTVTSDDLDAVLASADVVILAAASTTQTSHLIGETQLRAMKETAVLVNIARGALVDSDALVDALASGSIAGAGLDVTDPEPLPDTHALWVQPSCLITSHSADTPQMTAPLLASRITANVRAFTGHGQFVGVVDPVVGY
jgi:phosphoglycerate dehydrogenase-like enzyme